MTNFADYIYDGMRVIQERDGGNMPSVSYTRGNDLSGSMEGAGLPRQSEASAGGIGGLLARSAGYSCSDSTLTVSITNESSIDFIFWIYSDAGTNVDGEVVSAGSARDFTFSAVGGVQYTVWGTDNRFHELGIVNTWTATLDHHALDLGSEDPDPEDAAATDFGSVLCGDSDTWPRHDYYFADGNGNIVTLIDTNQAVSASYRYDPFGNITSQSGAMADANIYRFSSKEFHTASGLYYYGYRFYDPVTQRWANRDPLGEPGFEAARRRRGLKGTYSVGASAEVSQGQNLYAFVGNNPARYFDSLGLSSFCEQLNDRMNELSKEAMLADKMGDFAKFTELSHQLFGLARVFADLCDNPPPPPPITLPVLCPIQGRRVPQNPFPSTNMRFCQDHPFLCGGILGGLALGVTCVACPECCAIGALASL